MGKWKTPLVVSSLAVLLAACGNAGEADTKRTQRSTEDSQNQGCNGGTVNVPVDPKKSRRTRQQPDIRNTCRMGRRTRSSTSRTAPG